MKKTAQRRGKGHKLRVKKGWRSKAGIRDVVEFRHMRHTCGSHLLQGGYRPLLEMHEVSAWLGHSDIGVTMRHYASLDRRNSLHSAIERKAPIVAPIKLPKRRGK